MSACHCWCGARVINGHHCENGHLQFRDGTARGLFLAGVMAALVFLSGPAGAKLPDFPEFTLTASGDPLPLPATGQLRCAQTTDQTLPKGSHPDLGAPFALELPSTRFAMTMPAGDYVCFVDVTDANGLRISTNRVAFNVVGSPTTPVIRWKITLEVL